MILHSTNGKSPKVTITEGIANGLAPDGGLYMPDELPRLPQAFYKNIAEMSLGDIGFVVCNTLFGNVLQSSVIKKIVDDALNFNIPFQKVDENRRLLELFHGPTLSFKDLGARVMARLLDQMAPLSNGEQRKIIIATSGDSGGAIANAFLNNKNTQVYVLFPSGELTKEQIAEFSTLRNVKALEVDGTFDDCQRLVKEALHADSEQNPHKLTAGNSINLARELPSMIPFFYAYAKAIAAGAPASKVVMSVPCGNLGSLAAGLMAKKMGLPIARFIAANNANDVFVEYLKTGGFRPKRSLMTLASGMDVGNPSNLARIIDLYGGDLQALRNDVIGVAYDDDEISETISDAFQEHGLIVEPHGATALRALNPHYLSDDEFGIAFMGVHPAKYSKAVERATGVIPVFPAGFEVPLKRIQHINTIPANLGALNRALSIANRN